MKLLVILAVILSLFTACKDDRQQGSTGSSSKANKAVFKFTAIPDQDSTKLNERFSKVATYLEGKLGVKVEYVPLKDYAASVTSFKNNQVQLAWFGGLSGVKARKAVPGSKAIAQGAEDVHFITYFIANSSTGIKMSEAFPKDVTGKTLTFGSKGSTSGRLMPEFYIRKEMGKGSDEVFSKVGFSGDHSKTIALVQDGAYQVGALNFKVWEAAVEEKKVDTSKVNVIWKTPTYPDYNWSVRGDVDEQFGAGFADKVQKALLELDDADLLKQFKRSKFIEANNELYKPIEDTAKKLGLLD